MDEAISFLCQYNLPLCVHGNKTILPTQEICDKIQHCATKEWSNKYNYLFPNCSALPGIQTHTVKYSSGTLSQIISIV